MPSPRVSFWAACLLLLVQACPGRAAGFVSGADFAVALDDDGAVVAWGRDPVVQAEAPGGTGFFQLAAGANHVIALHGSGALVAWGDDRFGQNVAPAGASFVAIAAGENHGLALDGSGLVHAWGDDRRGQVGGRPTGGGFVALAGGDTHSLALHRDGWLTAWGDNRRGECEVPAGQDFIAVAAGTQHSLALRRDGSVVAWGDGRFGLDAPPAESGFVSITAAGSLAAALRADGSAAIWGRTQTLRDLPVLLAGPWTAIELGPDGMIARRADGTLFVAVGNRRVRNELPVDLVTPPPTEGQNRIRLAPPADRIFPGDRFTVRVWASGAGLAGLESALLLDSPAVASVVGGTYGGFFDPQTRLEIAPTVTPGEWFGALAAGAGSPPLNGTGVFADVEVRALAPGVARFSSLSLFVDASGLPLVHADDAREVTVSDRPRIEGRTLLHGRSNHEGVRLSLDGTGRHAFNDAAGDWRLHAHPGAYLLRAEAQGYLPKTLAVTLADDSVLTVPETTLTGGDADGDGEIGLADFTLLAGAFRTSAGDAGFNPAVDFNQDGQITLADLAILARGFGAGGGQQTW